MNACLRDWFDAPCLAIDVARYQHGKVPWPELYAAGFRFAVIKWWHAQWRGDAPTRAIAEQQLREAEAAGFIVGKYAWWDPLQPETAQIDAWTGTRWTTGADGTATLEVIGETWDDHHLPLMIDAEEPGAAKGVATRQALERIVLEIERRTGRKPMIYSGTWWVDAWMPGDSPVLAACPYVHAAYPGKRATGTQYAEAFAELLDKPAPTLPRIWRDQRPVMAQVDGDGGLTLPNGVDTDVDIADEPRLRALVPAIRDTSPGLAWSPTEPPPALQLVPEEQATVPGVLDMVAGPPPAPSVTQPGTPTAIRRSSSSTLRAVRPDGEEPAS